MPLLHRLEMLSNSTCSELCFSDSSQSSETCSLSSSPSDLTFDTVSQPPSDALLADDAPMVATVALPREDPRVVLTPFSVPAAETPTIPEGDEEVRIFSNSSMCYTHRFPVITSHKLYASSSSASARPLPTKSSFLL